MINNIPLNFPNRVCSAIISHYHKEGGGNIISGTTSIVKAPAILIEYE